MSTPPKIMIILMKMLSERGTPNKSAFHILTRVLLTQPSL